MAELLIIVPTLGRPDSIDRLLQAWDGTNAWQDADLTLAVDADDPHIDAYRQFATGAVGLFEVPAWQPMVAKLNAAAAAVADRYTALGFMGDDHVPRTFGWAGAYLDVLRKLGTGVVYGDDLHRGRDLCTQWAMTADIVRALGRMVPAPVRQQFCDRSVMVLGQRLDRLRFLPHVTIEHMHYAVGKGVKDATALLGNREALFRADRAVFERWLSEDVDTDVDRVVRACGLG